MDVIDGKTQAWQYHPCIKMWFNYRDCLQWYYNVFYDYCVKIHKINFIKSPKPILLPKYMEYPKWLGYEPLHKAYRANLLRKALEDLSKGRKELMENLTKQNILIYQYDLTTPYLWSIDKEIA